MDSLNFLIEISGIQGSSGIPFFILQAQRAAKTLSAAFSD